MDPYYRSIGVPAWVALALKKDPSIMAEHPGGSEPMFWTRKDGVRLAGWLIAALEKRGYKTSACRPPSSTDEGRE